MDIWNGPLSSVRGFAIAIGATHPVLRNGSPLRSSYGMGIDNYAVVDADGVIRYLSTDEAFGGFNDKSLRTVISQWLVTTAVKEQTWSAVKGLYGAEE